MLLKNAVTLFLAPSSVQSQDLRIEEGRVAQSGSALEAKSGEEIIDLSGKFVLPGMVCAHTHLYSSLARGMPATRKRPRDFVDILRYVWWKLDRALDDESIYYSALVGAVEAARCGTTAIIDHHASPCSIPGSLDIIKEAMQHVGLRGVLCYEVTDRGGPKARDSGLEENERFIKVNRTHSHFKGMVGAHASFTLGDESLDRLGEMAARCDAGVHLHVGEDACDAADARKKYSLSLIKRLDKHGILKNGSILAHCVHLAAKDFSILRRRGCWLVHNPRSNMNNAVGYAPVYRFGNRGAIGADGFPADMFEETRFGFFKMQEQQAALRFSRRGHMSPGELMAQFLRGGQLIISDVFGEDFGTLRQGSPADLIVLDYESPTPLTSDNLVWHFLTGMRSSSVESVMVGGRWVVKNREVVGVDLTSVYEKARIVAAKLWRKINS